MRFRWSLALPSGLERKLYRPDHIDHKILFHVDMILNLNK
jgi:hypothetical protein